MVSYVALIQIMFYYHYHTGTIMCYGQTGAGKTFTMTGATENYQHRGIIPRAIAQLFREIGDRNETAVSIR